MKRCPKSNRVATEQTLKFCRIDGTSLVALACNAQYEGAAAMAERAHFS
jgi:hypothetical protein